MVTSTLQNPFRRTGFIAAAAAVGSTFGLKAWHLNRRTKMSLGLSLVSLTQKVIVSTEFVKWPLLCFCRCGSRTGERNGDEKKSYGISAAQRNRLPQCPLQRPVGCLSTVHLPICIQQFHNPSCPWRILTSKLSGLQSSLVSRELSDVITLGRGIQDLPGSG